MSTTLDELKKLESQVRSFEGRAAAAKKSADTLAELRRRAEAGGSLPVTILHDSRFLPSYLGREAIMRKFDATFRPLVGDLFRAMELEFLKEAKLATIQQKALEASLESLVLPLPPAREL